MSVKNIIGVAILCGLFLAAIGCVIREIGWREFLAFLGFVVVMCTIVAVSLWCILT